MERCACGDVLVRGAQDRDSAQGGLLLDANGHRFCNELGHRDYVSGEMFKNKGPFRLVLNSSGGARHLATLLARIRLAATQARPLSGTSSTTWAAA